MTADRLKPGEIVTLDGHVMSASTDPEDPARVRLVVVAALGLRLDETPLKQADAMAIIRQLETTVTVGPFARLRQAGPLTVALVCIVLLATGCGNGQSSPRFNATNVMSTALKFVACMRSHGVPNMPDPQVFHSAARLG